MTLVIKTARPLYEIYNDFIQHTTGQEKNAIWQDMNAGNPKKYALSTGLNAGAISALDWAVQASGAGPSAIEYAQGRLVALYTQDNPEYLIHPPFAPNVNIPGYIIS